MRGGRSGSAYLSCWAECSAWCQHESRCITTNLNGVNLSGSVSISRLLEPLGSSYIDKAWDCKQRVGHGARSQVCENNGPSYGREKAIANTYGPRVETRGCFHTKNAVTMTMIVSMVKTPAVLPILLPEPRVSVGQRPLGGRVRTVVEGPGTLVITVGVGVGLGSTKQTSGLLPCLTTITGVALPSPLESTRVTTTLVPAWIPT